MLRARYHPEPRQLRFRPVTQFSVIAILLALVVGFGSFPVEVHGPSTSPTLQAARFSLPGLAAAVPEGGAAEIAGGPTPLTVVAARVEHVPVLSTDDISNRLAEEVAAIEERAGASAHETDVVESSAADERIPIFFEYEVQEGDTMSAIASRFGVGTDYIVWNNVDIIDDSNAVPTGIVLQIPSVEGIIHSVRVGETVSAIAERYDANVGDIVDFRANGFNGDPNNIREGVQILVPGGRIIPPPPPEPEPAPSAPSQPSPPSQTPPSGGTGAGGWVFPSDSRNVSSWFGPRHPLGVDWVMPIGSPIYAASSGQVVFVGGNPCCSYGYHIIIDHGNGYETLYAHLNQFAVSNGDFVDTGQVVGYSGNTGRSTGPHLHFEIRRNGVYQDPMLYLP